MRIRTCSAIAPGLFVTAMALAGCSGGGGSSNGGAVNQTANSTGNAAINVAANATNAVNAMNAANATNASVSAAATDQDAFSKYVGKYPFDKVGPHSWMDDPAVIKAVDAAVTDKEVREWVKGGDGPASAIERTNGKIMAWSCEAHNCGSHSWVTLIDPKTGTAEVCYFNEDVDPDKAHWFSGGKELSKTDLCPQSGAG